MATVSNGKEGVEGVWHGVAEIGKGGGVEGLGQYWRGVVRLSKSRGVEEAWQNLTRTCVGAMWHE